MLQSRTIPEKVCAELLSLNPEFSNTIISQHASSSTTKWWMHDKFSTSTIDLKLSYGIAAQLFPNLKFTLDDFSDEQSTITSIGKMFSELGVEFDFDEPVDFSYRLEKQDRRKNTEFVSSNSYNKRFRFALRCVEKIDKDREAKTKFIFERISKSRLSHMITLDEFIECKDAAYFIAYFVSQLNRRSQFTAGKQHRAFDKISEFLFKRIPENSKSWKIVSLVFPKAISKCSDIEKGEILSKYFSVMELCSKYLQSLVSKNDINMQTMVVKRGNDSYTWNIVAGAYNKCRDGWIEAVYSVNQDEILDVFLPGKVLRLMAADVAWGLHGGDLHVDNKVWSEIPKAWDVILGKDVCGKKVIRNVCEKYKVNVHSWILPREYSACEVQDTKNLLHGIEVSSKSFANLLKQNGYFAGSKGQSKIQTIVNVEKNQNEDGSVIAWQKSSTK